MQILNLAHTLHTECVESCAILKHRLTKTQEELAQVEKNLIESEHKIEIMGMARGFLQELVDVVSTQNLQKIEKLVNTALHSIFFDMDLEIRFAQSVKRGLNTYSIVFMEDGEEGTVNSNGGGVAAVVAMILKVMFNIVSGAFPLLAMDESLGFVSDKYISGCSKFIHELAEEFGIIVLLVSHKPSFSEFADFRFEVLKKGNRTLVNVHETASV